MTLKEKIDLMPQLQSKIDPEVKLYILAPSPIEKANVYINELINEGFVTYDLPPLDEYLEKHQLQEIDLYVVEGWGGFRPNPIVYLYEEETV